MACESSVAYNDSMVNILKIFLPFSILLMAGQIFATEAFILRVHHGHLSVETPKLEREKVSVIVENKTISNMKAKLASSIENMNFFSIEPGASVSIEVVYDSRKKLYFVPLSPPFEDVELKFNDGYYEVPQKK